MCVCVCMGGGGGKTPRIALHNINFSLKNNSVNRIQKTNKPNDSKRNALRLRTINKINRLLCRTIDCALVSHYSYFQKAS